MFTPEKRFRGQESSSINAFDEVKNRLYLEAKELYRDEASRHTNEEMRKLDLERMTKMRQQTCSQMMEIAKEIGVKKPLFDQHHKKFREQVANIDLLDGFFDRAESNKQTILERFEKGKTFFFRSLRKEQMIF